MEIEIFCLVGIVLTFLAARRVIHQEEGTTTFIGWGIAMMILFLMTFAAYQWQLLY